MVFVDESCKTQAESSVSAFASGMEVSDCDDDMRIEPIRITISRFDTNLSTKLTSSFSDYYARGDTFVLRHESMSRLGFCPRFYKKSLQSNHHVVIRKW
jgi:hypothetical protein